MVREATHFGWVDEPLAAMLAERTGLRVWAANAAVLGLRAESAFGAGRGIDDLVYLIGGRVRHRRRSRRRRPPAHRCRRVRRGVRPHLRPVRRPRSAPAAPAAAWRPRSPRRNCSASVGSPVGRCGIARLPPRRDGRSGRARRDGARLRAAAGRRAQRRERVQSDHRRAGWIPGGRCIAAPERMARPTFCRPSCIRRARECRSSRPSWARTSS